MAEILANPMVEALLAAIILISLAAEVKTAGFSGGALVAAIAGAILIGARWGGRFTFCDGVHPVLFRYGSHYYGYPVPLFRSRCGDWPCGGDDGALLYLWRRRNGPLYPGGCSDPFGCRLLFHRRPPVPEPAVAKAHPPYGAEGEGRIPFFLFRLQKLRGERGGCPFHPPSFGKGENRGLRTRCGLRWRVY